MPKTRMSTLTPRVAATIWHSSPRAMRYALALYFLHLDTAHRMPHMQTTDEQKIGGIARCQLLYLLTTAGIRAMGGTGQAEKCSVSGALPRAIARSCRRHFSFTVVFYGQRKICCKTAQFHVTRREGPTSKTPRIRDSAQCCVNMRKNSFFNYESTALTAVLQARRDPKVKHSKPQVTNPECIR